MFEQMTDKQLLEFCWDHFCCFDVCETLKCKAYCRDEDCPLYQLFERMEKKIDPLEVVQDDSR